MNRSKTGVSPLEKMSCSAAQSDRQGKSIWEVHITDSIFWLCSQRAKAR